MNNKNYIFTFEWANGCVNDYIRRYLKENSINYFYQHQEIKADLYGTGVHFKFDYEHINGNTYGIIAIPAEIR